MMGTTLQTQARLLLAIGLAICAAPSTATPSVAGVELVSSTRVDRTRFDYTYRIRVAGDQDYYTNAAFKVTSTAASSQVLKDTVVIGSLDAGGSIRTSDTFIVRQDRVATFDWKAISFTFQGSPRTADETSSLKLSTVSLLATAGRPLHEGSFPVVTVNPPIGAPLVLRAIVIGAVGTVSYRLTEPGGAVLSSGDLVRVSDGPSSWFVNNIITPNQAFKVTINAVSDSGAQVEWSTSTIYSPSNLVVDVQPSTPMLRRGSTVSGFIVVRSIGATGSYKLTMISPAGFTNQSGPWTILVAPNQTVRIPFSVVTPIDAAVFRPVEISVIAAPATGLGNETTANARFLIQ